MPETMTDLQQLQSFFSAQPWRQGCLGILAFVFRTRAHAATAPAAAVQQACRSAAGVSNLKPAAAVVVTAVCGDFEEQSDHSVAGRCDSRSKPRSKPSDGAAVVDVHVSCTAEAAKQMKPDK
jgi:hypothetical protein